MDAIRMVANRHGKWLVEEVRGDVHVMPLDDWIIHSRSRYCECRPYTEERMVVHHAADAREHFESRTDPDVKEKPVG